MMARNESGEIAVRKIGALVIAVLLAGCGTAQSDRTEGGAAGGAATGAAFGLIGGPVGVLVGAAVGAGAGALTGAAVDSRDLDLGPPPWSETKTEAPRGSPAAGGS
jgi:phage tail tape-measure protein